MAYKITGKAGYSPQIGHLVSMMDYARETTLNAVHGLTTKQLDYLPGNNSNTIGALLFHMAAMEFGFQIELFEGREPNQQEMKDWGAAYSLGNQGREEIRGYPLDYYLDKLEKVRHRTLAEFKKHNDDWLYQSRQWDGHSSNNYFIWFHVMEDEINHRGQIRIQRKLVE
ncbi:DinB family protein [Virgibacillus senegalensis]|uniref:DinB family protein n=1 Tax=Virgibacillus senegalensis TaxID=1499679 RepID=UPI00069F0B60|nr:DinB family protein [Virgibacillus senegalensis]